MPHNQTVMQAGYKARTTETAIVENATPLRIRLKRFVLGACSSSAAAALEATIVAVDRAGRARPVRCDGSARPEAGLATSGNASPTGRAGS